MSASPSVDHAGEVDAAAPASAVVAPAVSERGLRDLSDAGLPELLRRTRRLAPELGNGLVFTALQALFAGAGRIIAPLTVQRAIDAGLTPATVAPAVATGAIAVVVAWLGSVLLNRRLQLRIESALATLRRTGLRRIHDMAASQVDRHPSADLVTRLTSDVDQMTTFLQGGGIQFVTNAVQLVIAAGIMVVYSWALTIPVLLLAALLLTTMLLIQRVIARRYDEARRDLSRLQSAAAESVIGASVIRSTGTQERTRARLDGAVNRARDSLIRTLVPLHGNTSLGELAISTMTVAVLLGGVWWSLLGHPAHRRLSSGQLIAMVFLVTFFVRPLQFLVQSLGEAQNAVTGWRRSLELAEAVPAQTGSAQLPAGPISIRLEHVDARYGGGPLVLHDVDLTIAAGEQVAVVGRTGSGKSTFAKLLTQRVEPAAGTIYLNDVPLTEIAASQLPGRVVVIAQDPFLFDDTLGRNITLGVPGAGAADVLRVLAELALTEWFATLPDGLQTPVGQRGERLSVGERQLVALARTALVDPDLIVLDEATSGVDPATDVAVQRALAALTRHRTTVSIAHRMITAETADRVLVFADGRIVQSGHHRQLVTEGGPYASLVTAWNQHAHHAVATDSSPFSATTVTATGESDDHPHQP